MIHMGIEVATPQGTSTKDKGDLLETLARKFAETQNYEVETQLRTTAAELDLLCRHRVNGRTLYVECKAHRDTLGANPLKNLIGTLTLRGYDEAWLITTGPLGKDAKGLKEEWERKPAEERQRLSIYTPERIIDAFIRSKLIRMSPQVEDHGDLPEGVKIGDWILLLTPMGRFWAASTNENGVPSGVLVHDAETNRKVTAPHLLKNLGKMDSSLRTLDFEFGARTPPSTSPATASIPPESVVEVQHGESWSDYRPARPRDFVGRTGAQRIVMNLLEDVRQGATRTRVFAITGDSGMGKSSLIAKLRERSGNQRYRGKYFVTAIDCRAASNATYIAAALLKTLRDAAKAGFVAGKEGVGISDHSDPLNSESLQTVIGQLNETGRVLCLVFDQFEELYSRPELFSVFSEAMNLFRSAIGAAGPLVLGFAWRTDATLQQDHPAYFMWHRLQDYRLEVRLGPFDSSEATRALTIFEKELGEKLRPEIRRQILEASQGYPWLLKKICIHLYNQIRSGARQADLVETLDVASLFDRDVQGLTSRERTCLDLIAKSGPADWYQVLEASGQNVLGALQGKRLVVRSGDRVNVYWDIFREYLLTGNAPAIPFSYLPTSPSISALLRVACSLRHSVGTSHAELAKRSGLKEKTVGNVVRDLRMFGVASGSSASPELEQEVGGSNPTDVLARIRRVLKRHELTVALERRDEGTRITVDDIASMLKTLNPSAAHRRETWRFYAERMAQWLSAAGLLVADGQLAWLRSDVGTVQTEIGTVRRRGKGIFTGDAPPQKVVAAVRWLRESGPVGESQVKLAGFRNAVTVLRHFGLAEKNADGKVVLSEVVGEVADVEKMVWDSASSDGVVRRACELLRGHARMEGRVLGEKLRELVGAGWSETSMKRAGNAIRRWAEWVMEGERTGQFVPPRSRRGARRRDAGSQETLF